jgi:hypothetical protein
MTVTRFAEHDAYAPESGQGRANETLFDASTIYTNMRTVGDSTPASNLMHVLFRACPGPVTPPRST